MESVFSKIQSFVTQYGGEIWSFAQSRHGMIVIVAMVAMTACYLLSRRYLLQLAVAFYPSSITLWKEDFIKHQVVQRLSLIFPFVLLYYGVVFFGEGDQEWLIQLQRWIGALIWLLFGRVALSLVDVWASIHQRYSVSQKPVDESVIRVAKLIVIGVFALIIAAVFTGLTVLAIVSGISAVTAVVIMGFREFWLGFASGSQLSANDLLDLGDRLVVPKYGYEGVVEKMGVSTVTLRTDDGRIQVIPNWALFSEGFTNHRAVDRFGGRRIRLVLQLDAYSIVECSDDSKLRGLIPAPAECEIEGNGTPTVCSRRGPFRTNFSAFREYVRTFLAAHPQVNGEKDIVVRELAPTQTGIPLEVIALSRPMNWPTLERLQADIIEHLISRLQAFEVRLFQSPNGYHLHKGEKERTSAPMTAEKAEQGAREGTL